MKIRSRRAEAGFSLFVTLVMLVAMTLIAVGLMRVVDSGNVIINNLSFRQGALASADSGTEQAVAWLADTTNAAKLADAAGDYSTDGYYGNISQVYVDYTGTGTTTTAADDVDWMDPSEGRKSAPLRQARWLGTDSQGNRRSFLIERMCKDKGAVNESACVRITTTASGGTGGSCGNGGSCSSGGETQLSNNSSEVAYRVTTRTVGPKNAISYVQTVLVQGY